MFERQAALAALALRFLIAYLFAFHLFFKLHNGIDATVDSFIQRGYNGNWAYLDMLGELIVVPCLIVGAYSRYWMIALSPIMIGAIGVFWNKGMNFTFGGFELPFVWLMIMYILAILGDGPYAIKLPRLPFDGRHPNTVWRRNPGPATRTSSV